MTWQYPIFSKFSKFYCTADFCIITNLEIVNLHRPKTSSTSTRIMRVAHTAYTIKSTVVASLVLVTTCMYVNKADHIFKIISYVPKNKMMGVVHVCIWWVSP